MDGRPELLDGFRTGNERTRILVGRFVAVGAPVAQVLAGLGVEDDDPLVEVPVGDVQLVGLGVHFHVRGAAEDLGAVASLGAARLSDLHHEGPVPAELEHLVVVGSVAGDPDVAEMVHKDAVLARGPLVALSRIPVLVPPTVEHVSVRVELEHRGRRDAARGERWILNQPGFIRVEAAGSLDEPDVVIHVHGDSGDFPHRVGERRAAGPFARGLTADGERHPQNHQQESQILGLHCFLPEPQPRRYRFPAPLWRQTE